MLGLTRQAWTNRLGFGLFVAVALGVAAHGLSRIVLRRRRGDGRARGGERARVRLRPLRAALALDDGARRRADRHRRRHPQRRLGLAEGAHAVGVHNVSAVVLLVNAFLSLFYHLTTRAIRHFIPRPQGLLERTLDHLEYQSRGIFRATPTRTTPATS